LTMLTPSHPRLGSHLCSSGGCDDAVQAGSQMSRKRPANEVTCRNEWGTVAELRE
jgi:hypothetical protein